MMCAYFDNSATTAPCCEAVSAVADAMTKCWGNPSSTHRAGNAAKELLDSSREAIAKKLSCSPEEIYFTSGGTESNNLAIFGAAHRMRRMGKRIVATGIEHPSIDETLNQLEAEGFEVIKLKVDNYGRINEKELYAAVNSNTILITMMLVNNEIGAINPIKEICAAAKRKNPEVVFHTDAIQGFCKVPFKAEKVGVDLVTVTAHKIGGPKGIGALWIKKGARVIPNHFGGEQEKQLRPGTQAMPLIAAFGKAVSIETASLAERKEKMKTIEKYLKESIKDIEGIVLNSKEDAIPNIVNISALGIRSEIMLHFLENRGIYVSSGSACALGAKSHVLAAMGYDSARIDSAIRISFGRETEKEDIDELVAALKDAMSTLCR